MILLSSSRQKSSLTKPKQPPLEKCCTHNNRDGVGPGEDLFDQPVPVIQGLHHLALIFCYLKSKKEWDHEAGSRYSSL